ncbi:MAG: FAD-dependent oxidoreductase, partial [Gammaproteobacteria bacterium]|nr:FAD-dependent oxidoreductase [Gammaproteobacteria bacterium]
MVNNSIRKVAVVGSGVAGLTCAIGLQAAGAEVRVFEKSRGPGGRLSSKRVAQGSVDVGAQYFTVRSSAFADWLEREVGAQHLALWQGCLM